MAQPAGFSQPQMGFGSGQRCLGTQYNSWQPAPKQAANGQAEHYMTISAMDNGMYKQFSLEELRLPDYQKAKQGGSVSGMGPGAAGVGSFGAGGAEAAGGFSQPQMGFGSGQRCLGTQYNSWQPAPKQAANGQAEHYMTISAMD
eukprot:SAG31_NODE_7872_length_1576_cov_26.500339_2_plen_143_part_01